ncbi:endonuclease domain-containing 1 protein-like [Lepisosteus oculatus]|uniref:endonuclease domain-containing 1 protein-like n=1 Tax=Lepisosteus oculatus TaxID=7918 RepID=UPI00371E2B2C
MLLLPPLQAGLCLLLLAQAEVLKHTFKNTPCSQFFFKGQEARVGMPHQAARICQRYNNRYHFATLYDRQRRIPVYSAYLYRPKAGVCERADWFIEPQLAENEKSLKDMQDEILTSIDRKKLKESQAVSEDYTTNSSRYDRGHLNPCLHHDDVDSKTATFTLTNIVPQFNQLNQGTWNNYETQTMRDKSQECTVTYALVGAVPGNQKVGNDRVTVPSHIWAAACCQLNENRLRSWAAIATNDENETKVITVGELENTLQKIYNVGVKLFHPECPRN